MHLPLRDSRRRPRRRRSVSVLPVPAVSVLVAIALSAIVGQCSAAFMVPAPVVHLVTGGVAGGIGAFVAYPLDYVKTQLQTVEGQQKYKHGLDVFVQTLKENPFLLYKGCGIQVLGNAPEKAIKLGVNDVLQSFSIASFGSFPLLAQVLAGAAAGFCQVVVSSPIEVVKVNMQTSDLTTVEQVYDKVGGLPGLFRGSGYCIARDVAWTAMCLPLYHYWSSSDIGMPDLVAGALAGMLASGLVTPLDFLKTRVLVEYAAQQEQQHNAADRVAQYMYDSVMTPPSATTPSSVLQYSNLRIMNNGSGIFSKSRASTARTPSTTAATTSHTSTWALITSIAEKEGLPAFFSGVKERMIGSAPRFGTTLAIHDWLEHVSAQAGWLHHV